MELKFRKVKTLQEAIANGDTCICFLKDRKEVALKPSEIEYPWAVCPVCAGSISMENVMEYVHNHEVSHCEHCGQAIDWSEE